MQILASRVLILSFCSGVLGSCDILPECTVPDYTQAECRVLVENLAARMKTSNGVELRFQEPDAVDTQTWIAGGRFIELPGDEVDVRVAHPGEFAISLQREDGGPEQISLLLRNIHPQAEIRIGKAGEELSVASTVGIGTERRVQINLIDTEVYWIRGTLVCPDVYRILVVSDIQTNPTQYEIVQEAIQSEVREASTAGNFVAGIVMPGDLTESSEEIEFLIINRIMERATVPVATVPGNHDIYDGEYPYYTQNFGPGNYAFTVCDSRLVMLDTGSGELASSVLGRLPELFSRDSEEQHLITAMHHPPFPESSAAGWSDESDAYLMLNEFAAAGGEFVLAGHAHFLSYNAGLEVGGKTLRQIVSGTAGAHQGAGIPRYGYTRLEISPTGIDPCFVEVPAPGFVGPQGAQDQMRYCD